MLRRDPELLYYRRENFGIYCLSAKKNNILLWSHYANAHKGICVGFNTKELQEYLNHNYGKEGNEILLLRVNYHREFPYFDRKRYEDPVAFIVTSLITKSVDWEYEEEFRLISNTPLRNNFTIDLPDGIIVEVILGALISERNKSNIIDVLKDKSFRLKLCEAKISRSEFGLEFEPINY
jgi:Protein of unknown function (DUF2971)